MDFSEDWKFTTVHLFMILNFKTIRIINSVLHIFLCILIIPTVFSGAATLWSAIPLSGVDYCTQLPTDIITYI